MPNFWDEWKRRAGLRLLKKEVTEIRKAREIAHLESLPEIPFDDHRPRGVLLSDEIEHYATTYKMIDPFDLSKLKAARYELSVGSLYSIGGKNYELIDEPGKNVITIEPFEVAVIQTFERLNLPHFIIARWNIRVKWAYQGLLWVGAAQVDAGYKGYLDCPIYNLSNKPVTLYRGTELAVIDFVTTTPPTKRSVEFKYDALARSRILFEEYEPDQLESALAKLAREKITGFEKRIDEIQGTVSNSVGVILTAIGVLVAVLALFVGGQTKILASFSPSLIVSSIALVVAFLSLVNSKRSAGMRWPWVGLEIVGWLVCIALIVWLLSVTTAHSSSQTDSYFQPEKWHLF
jgi:deoxycytidine triphosphate deaminase